MAGYERLEDSERRHLVTGQRQGAVERRGHLLVVLAALIIVAAILGLGYGLPARQPTTTPSSDTTTTTSATTTTTTSTTSTSRQSATPSPPPPAATVGVFPLAAAASDGEPCATVARDLMAEGGTAVDAAVAALVCNGLVNPKSMGIGGGFIMTVFTRATGTVEVLNARETAPAFSRPDMYSANSSLSSSGALSVAVPGEVAGYWAARRRYGNSEVSWRRVLQPSIDLAAGGVPVSATLASAIRDKTWHDPVLAETYTDPSTGRGWEEGTSHKRPRLAETLERLALAGEEGEELFYRGELARQLVADLEERGGRLSLQDMADYRPVWVPALSVPLAR